MLKISAKKITSFLASTALCATLVSYSPSLAGDDWTDRWFESTTASGGSYHKGQKRGYLQGPQFSGRLRMTNDYLLTATPPKIRAGCGGIDLFAGGLSFLDPEYLVEKFENILQAAPALAFSMALKAHCETCEDVMSKLEATSSFLNSIQVNDCRMSNQVAKLITGDNPDFISNVLEEATGHRSLEDGLEKHYHGAQQAIRDENNSVPVNLGAEVEGCPTAIKELFADGSVIEHAAARVGMADMADIVRAYIGDVLIQWTPNSGPAENRNAPRISSIDRCPTMDRFSAYDFLTGEVMARPADGAACTATTNPSVIQMVRDNMTQLGQAVGAKRAFTNDEIAFINQSAQPVYEIIRAGFVSGNLDQAISAYEYPVASSLAYRIFDDLLTNIDFLVNKALSISSQSGNDGAEACNYALYEPAKAKLELLREDLIEARKASFQAYRTTVQEQHSFAAQAALFRDERDSARKNFLKTVADN